MRKLLTRALWVLVAIGVIRGLIRYQQDNGSTGIERLVTAIIGGVADVTYRWIPPILEWIASILSVSGGA